MTFYICRANNCRAAFLSVALAQIPRKGESERDYVPLVLPRPKNKYLVCSYKKYISIGFVSPQKITVFVYNPKFSLSCLVLPKTGYPTSGA